MKLQTFLPQIMAALGGDLAPWHHQCHAASIAIVRARIFPHARVARGWCAGVGGQHSWVVVGGRSTDVLPACFDRERAQIVDPTLWSYDKGVSGVWFGDYAAGKHTPHGGFGNIWDWGKPNEAAPGQAVTLTPSTPLSKSTAYFVKILGPLDRQGWAMLANHAPVLGWPSGEILGAMLDTKAIALHVPIDKEGMLTDRNPSDLYLAQPSTEAAMPACALCNGPADANEFCHGCQHHVCERCGEKESSRMQSSMGAHPLSDHEPSDEDEEDLDDLDDDDQEDDDARS